MRARTWQLYAQLHGLRPRSGHVTRTILAAGLVTLASAAWGAEVIHTLGAVYGTPATKHTCDATAVVAQACNGKTACNILASNALCGDPDYGTPKSLNVVFECGPALGRSVTAQEETEARLACE